MHAFHNIRVLRLVVGSRLGQKAAKVAVELAHPQVCLGLVIHIQGLSRQVYDDVV